MHGGERVGLTPHHCVPGTSPGPHSHSAGSPGQGAVFDLSAHCYEDQRRLHLAKHLSWSASALPAPEFTPGQRVTAGTSDGLFPRVVVSVSFLCGLALYKVWTDGG